MNIQTRTKASQPHGMKDGHRTEDRRQRTEGRGKKKKRQTNKINELQNLGMMLPADAGGFPGKNKTAPLWQTTIWKKSTNSS